MYPTAPYHSSLTAFALAKTEASVSLEMGKPAIEHRYEHTVLSPRKIMSLLFMVCSLL